VATGWPQVIVEGGFATTSPVQPTGTLILDDAVNGLLDTGMLGGDVTWSDLSPFARSGTVTRPGSREQGPLWSNGPATAAIVLKNGDGRFDPDNLAGPYAPGGVTALRAMAPVRVRVTWAGMAYPLFSGFADSWEPEDGRNYASRYAQATVTATDGQKVLAGVRLPAVSPAGAGTLSGNRVTHVLDLAGWYTGSGYRDVDTGKSGMQAYAGGDTAWNLARAAADAELGDLWIDGSGRVVFRGRHATLTDARSSTVQAVFGDRPGNLAPEASASPALNANPGFDNGIANWTSSHAATLAYSQDVQYGPRPGVMSLHGDGATANPRALGSLITGITPGATYTAFIVTWTAGTPAAQVDWKTSGGAFISSSALSAAPAAAGPWQVLTVTDTAPATAATATLITGLAGTPAAGVMLYTGYAVLIAGDGSSAPAELAYASVLRARDDSTLANDVQATRAGGTLQQVQDAASIARFLFPRTYARSDLILQDDATALQWAQWVLYVAAGDEDRFDTLVITPMRDPANLWPQALGREIGDRVQVWRRPPGVASPVAKDCFIRGITHAWDESARSWTTTWTLQDAAKYGSFLTLDNPILGALDSNALAY